MGKILKEIIIKPGQLRDAILMTLGAANITGALQAQNNPIFGFKPAVTLAEGAQAKNKGYCDFMMWRLVEAEGFDPINTPLQLTTSYDNHKGKLQICEIDEKTGGEA